MFSIPNYSDFMKSWVNLASAYTEMSLNASEVIYHRTLKMASGSMTPPEAVEMVMEKCTAFASSTENATMAAAKGGDMLGIATAALTPYGTKARENADEMRG